jgi:hypothetical protein
MSRRKLIFALLALLLVGSITAGIAIAGQGSGNNKTFEFTVGLWGDMPYSDAQAQTGVPNLIADMNNSDISFSVHDGDLKAGSATKNSATPTDCSNALYAQALGYFNSLQQPAFFTTGDNDWTDCDRNSNGPFNSLERLQYERGVFFSGSYAHKSMGQKQMTVEVQSTPLCLGTTSTVTPETSTFQTPCVENRRWTFHKVTFATLNVQGTCNNLCGSGSASDPAPGDTGDPNEFAARNAADIQWLKDTFAEAAAQKSAGVMIIWQADPGFDTSGYQGAPKRNPTTLAETDVPAAQDGFQSLLLELRKQTIVFAKPVVLVHGDSHYFRVDRPLMDSTGLTVQNFTRVETFGDHQEQGVNNVHWVKALIDPNSKDVFAFQPQTVTANLSSYTP